MSEFTREGLEPLATLGNDTPRIDAIERVTGQAKFTRDWKLPGMLYAKVLRSPHPHARMGKRIPVRGFGIFLQL